MTVFYVSNMKCVHCQKRITDAFEKEQLNAAVDLESKTVKVADENCDKAAQILDDLGFDAKIEK